MYNNGNFLKKVKNNIIMMNIVINLIFFNS